MNEPAMTEQPPYAIDIVRRIRNKMGGDFFMHEDEAAGLLDCIFDEIKTAETERCALAALEQRCELTFSAATTVTYQAGERTPWDLACATIADAIRAPAERPAPPQRHLTVGERLVLRKAHLASSRIVQAGDAKQTWGDAPVAQMAEAQGLNPGQCQFESDPAHQPPTSVVDHTERAREIVRKYIKLGVKFVVGPNVYAEWMKNDIADALSAVAAEREAAAERPAPEGPQPDVWTEEDIRAGQAKADELVKAFEQQDALASERDAALHAAPSPSAVDYTEQAVAVHCKWFDDKGMIGATRIAPHQTLSIIPYIARALSAVASERDAAAFLAFGKRVWSDTEEVAYQAGVSDTLERLQAPYMREAIKAAMRERDFARDGEYLPDDCYEALAGAALTKIAKMLK